MPDIYVDVGPMDAAKAPKEYAAKVKGYMQAAADKAVKAASGFTADKKGDGYTVRIKVTELKLESKSASIKLSGELLRYPKPEMVSTSITANSKADGGKPDDLVKDVTEAAVEGMMKKVVAAMKAEAR